MPHGIGDVRDARNTKAGLEARRVNVPLTDAEKTKLANAIRIIKEFKNKPTQSTDDANRTPI